MDALLYLHRSGTVLYMVSTSYNIIIKLLIIDFQGDNEPALSETVFLDCQWLIRLMSTITTPTLKVKGLLSSHSLINCVLTYLIDGILTHVQLEQIWRQYPQSHFEKMLLLMEQFYVLFRLPNSNTYQDNTYYYKLCKFIV